MTKREEVKARRLAWNNAIREGRAVRFDNGDRARSYLTRAEAERAVAMAERDGRQANVIDPALAQ